MNEANPIVKQMVNRFLGWKLPKSFSPDCGVSFKPLEAAGGSWPIGTNLLSASEATAMFEHCIGPQPTPQGVPDNYKKEVGDMTFGNSRYLLFRSQKPKEVHAAPVMTFVARSDDQRDLMDHGTALADGEYRKAPDSEWLGEFQTESGSIVVGYVNRDDEVVTFGTMDTQNVPALVYPPIYLTVNGGGTEMLTDDASEVMPGGAEVSRRVLEGTDQEWLLPSFDKIRSSQSPTLIRKREMLAVVQSAAYGTHTPQDPDKPRTKKQIAEAEEDRLFPKFSSNAGDSPGEGKHWKEPTYARRDLCCDYNPSISVTGLVVDGSATEDAYIWMSFCFGEEKMFCAGANYGVCEDLPEDLQYEALVGQKSFATLNEAVAHFEKLSGWADLAKGEPYRLMKEFVTETVISGWPIRSKSMGTVPAL